MESKKKGFMELPQLIEGEVKIIKRREIDCDHRRRWQVHCHGTSRQDKDRISDSMATTRDFCTKVGGEDKIMDYCNVVEYRPTPPMMVH